MPPLAVHVTIMPQQAVQVTAMPQQAEVMDTNLTPKIDRVMRPNSTANTEIPIIQGVITTIEDMGMSKGEPHEGEIIPTVNSTLE
jgi:hypothetical protein